MNTEPTSSSPPWLPWVLGSALIVVSFIVFCPTVGSSFVQWDDDINIYRNPHIHGLTPDNVYWIFSNSDYTRRYMPFGWFAWALDYQVAGMNPAWYHAGNVILHCINAGLVFSLLRQLISRKSAERTTAWLASAAGALVWAIHPLRVESVAWASSRIYSQALLFALASVLLYWRFALAPSTSRPRRLLWASALCYVASMLTYPITLGVGIVPLILDVFPLKRFCREGGGWWTANNRQILLEKLPYAAALALVLSITIWARLNAAGAFEPPVSIAQFGLLPRAMQAFYIWGHYIWKPLVPTNLAPIYTTLIDFNPLGKRFVLSAVGVLALTLLLARERKRWPGALAVWITYLLFMIPVLGLTEYPHFPSDRYSYLSGILLSLALAAGLVKLRPQRLIFTAAFGLLLLAAAAATALTLQQIRIWRNTETLTRHMIAHVGDSPVAGPIYLRLGATLAAQGRNKEALEAVRNAVRLTPAMSQAHSSLAALLATEGRPEEAVAEYRAALHLTPDAPETLNSLAWLLATHPDEKIRNGPEAVRLAGRAMELSPKEPSLLRTLAAAYAESGRFPEAIVAAERFRALVPPELAAREEHSLELYRAGKPAREAQ